MKKVALLLLLWTTLCPLPVHANDLMTVINVQVILNAHGYDVGKPDGISGPATRKGIKLFAKDYGAEESIIGVYAYALKKNFENRKEISDPELIVEIQTKTAAQLRDPDSAKFRNLYTIAGPNITGGGEQTFVCGEVNGKNAYGGYAGYALFHGSLTEIGQTQFFSFSNIDGESPVTKIFCETWFPKS